MASYTWGLVASDITVAGVGRTSVDSNSLPVTSTQVNAWIAEGSGVVNGLLQKSGIQPDAAWALANPDGAEIARAAVMAYASERAASLIGMQTIYEQEKARWDEMHARLGTIPQALGDAYVGTRQLAVDDIDDEPSEPWDWATMAGNVW